VHTILVLSSDPRLAEASRKVLPEGTLQVFCESNWLRALQLAIHRPFAAILVDVRLSEADAFDVGRTLWFHTRRPVLFVDGFADIARLSEDTALVRSVLETAYPVQDDNGWTTLVSDDIAASKRTATRARTDDDLIHRAPRRFG
jgi:response regulator RpfG family c-di-GMP phosphodiesterase